jgi:methyl-accepting chemotaxis protein
MDFEEKIDALRMNLELAFHDIEAFRAGMQEVRASIQELRVVTERQNEGMQEMRMGMQELRMSIQELRLLSESQYGTVRDLLKVTGDLVALSDSHERRIQAIERRS